MTTGRIILLEEALTKSVIGGFFSTARKLGFGYLESIYRNGLEKELIARGHKVRREVGVPVFLDGEQVGFQRIDMIVDDRLIVEVKSTEVLPPSAKRQLLSYLTSTRFQVGLLLHFGPKPKFYRLVSTKKVDEPPP